MSRVGKKEIKFDNNLQIQYKDRQLTVKGKLGELSCIVHNDVDLNIQSNTLNVITLSQNKNSKSLQGLTRSKINNMIIGVTEGFNRKLEVNGIGYRSECANNIIKFTIGYSHPVEFKLPEGITAKIEKQNQIVLNGIDKELMGLIASKIRKLRPPEPYKGKGIKFFEEKIQKKAGKTGAK